MWNNWDKLPKEMKNHEVKKYFFQLKRKRVSLILKRVFDIVLSSILIVIFLPLMFCFGLLILLDSPGPIFYKQERVTKNLEKFHILKFRTMVNNADKIGPQVTVKEDSRITKVGKLIRKHRIDEIPQLFNIFKGEMSFVGTRPEVNKYVNAYTNEMLSTLLLPAGLTSEASINYKDEEKLLNQASDVDHVYINEILPEKMKYNLQYLENFSFLFDCKILLQTFFKVFIRR